MKRGTETGGVGRVFGVFLIGFVSGFGGFKKFCICLGFVQETLGLSRFVSPVGVNLLRSS